jgi:hypothetical protein
MSNEMRPVNQPLGLDQCNCFTMRKANRQISRFYDADLEPTCLRITQFPTLAIVIEVGTAALDAHAGRIDIEHTAMGKMAGFWNVTAWSESEPHRPMAEDAL